MRIYLAARYSRINELNGYADKLRELGHVITSRWLDGDHQIDDKGLSCEADRPTRERFALEDIADLSDAELVITFTETPRSSNSRGGRHVEFGYALGLGIVVAVVGPRENVFHCLPRCSVFETFDELLSSGLLKDMSNKQEGR